MRIADVEFLLLSVPGGGTSIIGGETGERLLLVRLVTASGAEGWGEARTTWRADEISLRRDRLLPIVAGRNVADIEELLRLDGLAPPPLRAAVEMACWDLIGRAARQPLCRLWGGEYRPHVPVAVCLPAADAEQTALVAHDLAERGFLHQSITASGNAEDDLQTVEQVRQAVGDRVKLRLDGSGRFAAEQARELCNQLEQAGLDFFLDPLPAGLDGLAALQRQTSVPLAVSSAVRAPGDVLAVARSGAGLHVVIDLAQVGGLWNARQCAVVANAAHLPASLRGAAGLGVGLASVVQLAASTPNLGLAHEVAGYQFRESVLQTPPVFVEGTVAALQGAGLGVEVDRLKIEAYQVM